MTQPRGLKASWEVAERVAPVDKLSQPTTHPVNPTLMQWGPIQFTVWPLNVHEINHETETDWAHKPIAGAAIYREWVGENDEILHIQGNVFPYRIGGLTNLEAFEALRRAGIASMLVRGDGTIMGWYVCERLIRGHQFLSSQGVGQQVAFEASFARVPVPLAENVYSQIWETVAVKAGK